MPDDDPMAAHRAYCGAIWSGVMAENADIGAELQRRQKQGAWFLGDPAPAPKRDTSWAAGRKAELQLFGGKPG
jgi:hypothetical protein